MESRTSRRAPDPGLFGPDSVSWKVHGETTVLFGGARAMLMQAAHPLVMASARDSGIYRRDPWRRLQRTLQITYAITFGSTREARWAVEHINEIHRTVRGVDQVTGRPYDAMDPDLLLWVHACLVDSALLFERRTVGRLDDEGRQRFHEEQMTVAELLGLPRGRIPPTVGELRAYVDRMVSGGTLLVNEGARAIARLIRRPTPDTPWPLLHRPISLWAFGTLPPPLRRAYGVRWTPAHEAALRASLRALRVVRPAIPRRFRRILPAELARARMEGRRIARPE